MPTESYFTVSGYR